MTRREEDEGIEIKLTQGQIAIVSASDFAEISKYRWSARFDKGSKAFYAIRNSTLAEGVKRRTILMHRQIMGFPEGLQIDHIYGKTLDNRRSQLRVATKSENMRNRKLNCNNTSGYKGVHLHVTKKPLQWRAAIFVDKNVIHLGLFSSPEEAHAAYCEAAKRHFGEYMRSA